MADPVMPQAAAAPAPPQNLADVHHDSAAFGAASLAAVAVAVAASALKARRTEDWPALAAKPRSVQTAVVVVVDGVARAREAADLIAAAANDCGAVTGIAAAPTRTATSAVGAYLAAAVVRFLTASMIV